MAVSEFSSSIELGTKPTITAYPVVSSVQVGEVLPPGGTHNPRVINKAWHGPTTQWVRWLTENEDSGGEQYPGPGIFSECSDFRLEVVTYQPVE